MDLCYMYQAKEAQLSILNTSSPETHQPGPDAEPVAPGTKDRCIGSTYMTYGRGLVRQSGHLREAARVRSSTMDERSSPSPTSDATPIERHIQPTISFHSFLGWTQTSREQE
jgi:hypothetical protein